MRTAELPKPSGRYQFDDDALVYLAAQLAEEVHHDQIDKAGEPYYHHVSRVGFTSLFLPHIKPSPDESYYLKVIGLLHDSIEDGEVVFVDGDTTYSIQEAIEHLFPDEVYRAVIALTKRESEPYFTYLERVKENKLASIVKLHDLADNMNMFRFAFTEDDLTEVDLRRLNKYRAAAKLIYDNLLLEQKDPS